MRTIAPEYSADYESGVGVNVRSVGDYVLGRVRGPLWAVFGAASFVLLIACVNVASLLLTRGTARAKEMAVRTALGAGRRSVIRRLLTEASVLSVAGAMGGLLIALGGTRALVSFIPPQIPRFNQIAPGPPQHLPKIRECELGQDDAVQGDHRRRFY